MDYWIWEIKLTFQVSLLEENRGSAMTLTYGGGWSLLFISGSLSEA